jgi:uncharacterized protein YecE (DUF72 family)
MKVMGPSVSVKAPRLITHYKKFIETKRMVQDFYGTVQEGLKRKVRMCFVSDAATNGL